MRPRRIIDRVRHEPNPLLRVMMALAGVLILLTLCVLCGMSALLAVSYGSSQFGPGGAFAELQEGQPAPDFELETLDGETVRLSDYRGAPVALNFWATWCLPCVLEIPALNAAARDYADEGLVVLSIDVQEPRDTVAPFAREHEIAYTVLLDRTGEVADAYEIVGMPTTLWIDADGVLRSVDHGVQTADSIAKHIAGVTRSM